MRQQKSHDIDKAIRSDAQRLLITLISVAVLVTALYLLQQRFHIVERYVVIPETHQATSPAPSVQTTPPQTSPAAAKK